MKKPIIIVFIVILALHLLALTFFLLMQEKEHNPTDEMPAPKKDPVLIPEPELANRAVKSKTDRSGSPHATVDKNSKLSSSKRAEHHTAEKKQNTEFYVHKKIPAFNFSKSVNGNISAIPETKDASSGILVDMNTGKVLWNKNAKKTVPIASMTKMMTALLAFEDIRDGKVKYDQIIKVSKNAAAIGGSDIWLDPRESFPLKELLKAVLIKSANDAAFLVGEYLGGGNIENFVKRMNRRASELKLKARYFNPHGLPEKSPSKDNTASPEDLAKLAAMLLQFPELVKISSTPIDYIARKVGRNKKTMLTTTNKLLRSGVKGVDGMKTGYTRRSGFCITVTCLRNNRRLIAVVTGFKNSSERNSCVKKLLDWGYKR